MYEIRLGVPEMEALWSNLIISTGNWTAGKDEEKLYKKLGKAMALLAQNPRYPGLNSHENESLSRRYGMKVWQSYLENKTSSAGRIY